MTLKGLRNEGCWNDIMKIYSVETFGKKNLHTQRWRENQQNWGFKEELNALDQYAFRSKVDNHSIKRNCNILKETKLEKYVSKGASN